MCVHTHTHPPTCFFFVPPPPPPPHHLAEFCCGLGEHLLLIVITIVDI
ncbi:hypothetical protein ABG752_00355 [Streptococcus iniae]